MHDDDADDITRDRLQQMASYISDLMSSETSDPNDFAASFVSCSRRHPELSFDPVCMRVWFSVAIEAGRHVGRFEELTRRYLTDDGQTHL